MTQVMREERSATVYVQGALCGLAAVSIWAGFIVVARLGIRTSLTPWDITAIRFAVSGSLLLPYAIHKGLALRPWRKPSSPPSAASKTSHPTTGTFAGRCAREASGQVPAAPLSITIKSRRLIR